MEKVYAVVRDYHTKKYTVVEYEVISVEGDDIIVVMAYPLKSTYQYRIKSSYVFLSKEKAIEHERDKLLKELEIAKSNAEKFLQDVIDEVWG